MELGFANVTTGWRRGMATRALLCLLALATACGDGGGSDEGGDPGTQPEPKTGGELGGGSFWYRCVGNTDTVCPDGFRAQVFPQLFAVGGRFGLAYEPVYPDGGEPPVVDVSSTELVSQQGGVLTLLQAGVAGVVVFRRGNVLDALHLEAVSVERAVIVAGGAEVARVEVPIGEKVSLRGEPRSALNSPLAGALTYAWTVADPTLVSFGSLTNDNRVVIVGDALGLTQLKVVIAEVEFEVEVEVVAPPEPDGAQRVPSSTTGQDTDSGDPTDTAGEESGTASTESATDSATDSGSGSGSGSSGTGGGQ